MTIHQFDGSYESYFVSARTQHTARKKLEAYLRKEGDLHKLNTLRYSGTKGDVAYWDYVISNDQR